MLSSKGERGLEEGDPVEAGNFEAGADCRHGGKSWAMKRDSKQSNVALGSVPRLEQGTGPCSKIGNTLI